MPWNLLLLPLLGGFYYCTHSYTQKYRIRRLDGYRLLLESAYRGTLFLVVSMVALWLAHVALGFLAASFAGPLQLLAWWRETSPFPHTGKAVMSLVLAYAYTELRNRVKGDADDCRQQVIADEGLNLEQLFIRAYREEKELLVSMKSGKVYRCQPLEGSHPGIIHTHVPVIPLQSGCRHNETQHVKFHTDYQAVYAALREAGREEDISDFELILPVAEIASVTIFQPDIWETWFKGEPASTSVGDSFEASP